MSTVGVLRATIPDDVRIRRAYRPGRKAWYVAAWIAMILGCVVVAVSVLGGLCHLAGVALPLRLSNGVALWLLLAFQWASIVFRWVARGGSPTLAVHPGDPVLQLHPEGFRLLPDPSVGAPWEQTRASIEPWTTHDGLTYAAWLDLRYGRTSVRIPLYALGLTAASGEALLIEYSQGRCRPELKGKARPTEAAA